MAYAKPYKSLQEQLQLLSDRGLQFTDPAEALSCLHRNGYYRLSAYWFPFREILIGPAPKKQPQPRRDEFLEGSRFEDAKELYVFDKRLKLKLLDAIERVEIAVRVQISLQLGAYDTFAHTRPELFHPNFLVFRGQEDEEDKRSQYEKCCDKLQECTDRSSEEFLRHYKHKYGETEPLPIWMAIELWDFGLMARYYSGMKFKDQEDVARRFDVPERQVMKSWLRSLNMVRNIIAHHGRLWNRSLTENPKPPTRGTMPAFDVILKDSHAGTRIYSICCILAHFSRVINPQSDWPSELAQFIREFPAIKYCSVRDMGFPPDWQTHEFWK